MKFREALALLTLKLELWGQRAAEILSRINKLDFRTPITQSHRIKIAAGSLNNMAKNNHPLGELVVRLYPRLLDRMRSRLRGHGDAEDLVQDLYLRLRGVSNETVVHKPEAYVFQAADYLAIERYRRARVTVEDINADLVDAAPSVEREIDGRRRLDALRTAVEALPARQREAFVLAKFHGMAQDEIADKMGISRSAVEKLPVKALSRCRAALEGLT